MTPFNPLAPAMLLFHPDRLGVLICSIQANQASRKGAKAAAAEQKVEALRRQREAQLKREQALNTKLEREQADASAVAQKLSKEMEEQQDPAQQALREREREKAQDAARMHSREIREKKAAAVEQLANNKRKFEEQAKEAKTEFEKLGAELVSEKMSSQKLLESVREVSDAHKKRKLQRDERDAKERIEELGAKKKANVQQQAAQQNEFDKRAKQYQARRKDLEQQEDDATAAEAQAQRPGSTSFSKELIEKERAAKAKVKEVSNKQTAASAKQEANRKQFLQAKTVAVREQQQANGLTPSNDGDSTFRSGGHLHVKEAYPHNQKHWDLSKTGRALSKWCTTQNGVVPCEELEV